MKIIIAGAGRIGSSLAEALCREGHDLSIIDSCAETISHVSDSVDALCVTGSATSPDVLCDAGVADADLLLAVTEQDEVNLVCAAAARSLGTKRVVARVRDTVYLGKAAFLEQAFGISVIVNPEYESALEIARILKFPGAARVDTFSKGRIEIVEYPVPEGSRLVGTALKNLSKLSDARLLVSLAERDGHATIPNGDFVIAAGDRLSFTGDREELRRFFVRIGAYSRPVRSVIIMGGNRISVYLARLLSGSSIRVTIIEKNRARCEELSDLLPDARIICGDAAKSEVLHEEGIKEGDAFVALTQDDGDNIITSIYAAHCGVGRIVTKVDHEHFSDVLDGSGLSCFVTPKTVVVSQLTRYVRAISDSARSGIITLYRLCENKAEAIEFQLDESSRCLGVPLKQLELKDSVLVAGIIRGSNTIVPDGATVLKAGDHIIIFSTAGVIHEPDDILL